MDFLRLVQDLARQSGTLAGGTTIPSVTGVSGRADKLVNWIASAWEDIQNQRQWNWLRGSFEQPLLANTPRYTAASFSIERFSTWVEDTRYLRAITLFDPAIGRADEGEIYQTAYDSWRVKYDRGIHDATRPVEWAISPTGELCFGPTPDKAYVARGDYVKSPQVLADNTDIPEAPERFHKAIVYRAMELMAESDESVPTLQMAQREYRKLFVGMCNDRACLPSFSLRGDGPLA